MILKYYVPPVLWLLNNLSLRILSLLFLGSKTFIQCILSNIAISNLFHHWNDFLSDNVFQSVVLQQAESAQMGRFGQASEKAAGQICLGTNSVFWSSVLCAYCFSTSAGDYQVSFINLSITLLSASWNIQLMYKLPAFPFLDFIEIEIVVLGSIYIKYKNYVFIFLFNVLKNL